MSEVTLIDDNCVKFDKIKLTVANIGHCFGTQGESHQAVFENRSFLWVVALIDNLLPMWNAAYNKFVQFWAFWIIRQMLHMKISLFVWRTRSCTLVIESVRMDVDSRSDFPQWLLHPPFTVRNLRVETTTIRSGDIKCFPLSIKDLSLQ